MADTALAGKLRIAAGSRIWVSDVARSALLRRLSDGATWSALRLRPLKPGEAPFTGGR